jgi:hypothetical protein
MDVIRHLLVCAFAGAQVGGANRTPMAQHRQKIVDLIELAPIAQRVKGEAHE